MTDAWVCWKCGASIAQLPMPLARLAECPSCNADLHVCRMCAFYDTRVAKHCRETVAEEVKDKERANFCDYFQAIPDAYRARDDSAARAARAQLDSLFGAPDATQAASGGSDAGPRSEADAAREALERLFRSKDPD